MKNTYLLTYIYANVTESNCVQFLKIANIQFDFLVQDLHSHGDDFVNWRVNFSYLYEYVVENKKNTPESVVFVKSYECSASILYAKLGLEY